VKSISELAGELKGVEGGWEAVVLGWAYGMARGVAEVVLQQIDQELMKKREKGLRVKGFKERCLTTVFGDVRIKRRLYVDQSGKQRYLLDEAIGLRKRAQVSSLLAGRAVFLGSHTSFEKCEQILDCFVPQGISHTTVHRLVGKVVDIHLNEEAKEIGDVFEEGVIPEGEGRVVPYLLVEGDGTNIALQREEERRAEVKVGIAYEGWQMVGKDRYALKEKSIYAGIMSGQEFWEGFSVALAHKYDLAKVGQVIVGGDGAEWVKEGAEVLGGMYQLDRFHLLRALRGGLREEEVKGVYEACITGDVAEADGLLRQAQGKAKGEAVEKVAQLRGYLLNNASGLRDYRLEVGKPHLRGLGAIESNIDKLVAHRMKKDGMSWTKRGGDRMVRLICLREKGELQTWINRWPEAEPRQDSPPEEDKPKGRRPDGEKYSVWLEAKLPALHGPHCNRPWVQALSAIAHANGAIIR